MRLGLLQNNITLELKAPAAIVPFILYNKNYINKAYLTRNHQQE